MVLQKNILVFTLVLAITSIKAYAMEGPFDESKGDKGWISFFNKTDLAKPDNSIEELEDHLKEKLFDYSYESIKKEILLLSKTPQKILTTHQVVLVAKFEHAKQQGYYVWLSDDWRAVFCGLPEPFYSHYEDFARSYGDFIVEFSEIFEMIKAKIGALI